MDELGGGLNCRSDRDVWSGYGSEKVLCSSYFLQLTVANLGSEFDEAGLIAFDYEASAT